MIFLSFDFGITWDEGSQSYYGQLILRYFLSGGKNRDFMTHVYNNYLYGGLFDVLAGLAYALPLDTVKHFAITSPQETINGLSNQYLHQSGFFETRHAANALAGFLAMFYTGLLTKEISHWKTACLALIFMALSPRFFGHSMNNPKDIPFAAAYVSSLYYMLRWLKEFPYPSAKNCFFLVIAMASAIGVRIGGIILIFYLILFSALSLHRPESRNMNRQALIRLIGTLAAIALLSYLGGLIFWPYGQLNPLKNPFLALREFFKFSAGVSQLLFEGKMISTTNLPWYYIPKWILISSPLFAHAGVITFFLFFNKIWDTHNKLAISLVIFSLVFPLSMVFIQKPILYDEWRHFLFVYPSLIIISTLGWECSFKMLQNKFYQFGIGTALLMFLYLPFSWMIRNHPHEYAYFNSLVGGLRGANGYYDTDYWGNSLRLCSEWLGGHIHEKVPGDSPQFIYADGDPMSTFPYLRKKLGTRYIPFNLLPDLEKKQHPPNYGIFFSRSWSGELIRSGLWPPKESIYKVNADNVTLCAVIENPVPA